MKAAWKKVFSSEHLIKVELMASLLRENGIETVVVNKKNSMIPTFGHVELHASEGDLEKAAAIIEKAG